MSGTLRRAGATARGRHRRGRWVVWLTFAAVAGVPSPLFAEPTETNLETVASERKISAYRKRTCAGATR